jgi:hypothetical protein
MECVRAIMALPSVPQVPLLSYLQSSLTPAHSKQPVGGTLLLLSSHRVMISYLPSISPIRLSIPARGPVGLMSSLDLDLSV